MMILPIIFSREQRGRRVCRRISNVEMRGGFRRSGRDYFRLVAELFVALRFATPGRIAAARDRAGGQTGLAAVCSLAGMAAIAEYPRMFRHLAFPCRHPIRCAIAFAMTQILALLLAAGPGRAEDLTVFAAASLKDALETIAADFESETGHDVYLSFAGSSVLARQIEQGAPADVFVSANPGWMDRLDQAGLLEPGSRIDLLRGSLVLVRSGADDAQAALPDALQPGRMAEDARLAMALVDAVPAGIYGKAALDALGLWSDLQGRVVQTDNVRAALALVALGEAEYGIVYATDALAEPRVTAIATFPEDSHPPIIYPAAAIAGRRAVAAAFLVHLRGEKAREVFERLGFAVLAAPE